MQREKIYKKVRYSVSMVLQCPLTTEMKRCLLEQLTGDQTYEAQLHAETQLRTKSHTVRRLKIFVYG